MTVGLVIAIAVGGGVGSALRYLVDDLIRARIGHSSAYPWGTTAINVTGSFVLGVITGFAGGQASDPVWLTVAGVGLLGGYTTFSTASVETVRLLLDRRYGAGLMNGLGMLIGCVVAAGGGLLVSRL